MRTVIQNIISACDLTLTAADFSVITMAVNFEKQIQFCFKEAYGTMLKKAQRLV